MGTKGFAMTKRTKKRYEYIIRGTITKSYTFRVEATGPKKAKDIIRRDLRGETIVSIVIEQERELP
jgi:hypothetical protein